jgi:uncharacterized protein YdeI (YjbR/CyaY-like superfamily)
MSAAVTLDYVPSLSVPAELAALFEESAKMNASFARLVDRDRRGFVRFIEEAKTSVTRERRAAIVAMSLMGLAVDLPDDPR